MKIFKQFIAIVFLVAIFVVGFISFENYRRTNEKSFPLGLELDEDGAAYMIGRVLKNETGCRENSVRQCYLVLGNGKGEARITYDSDDANFCNNEGAAREGRRALKGDRIEAYGAYYKLGGEHLIGTCVLGDYYIRILK